MKTANTTRRSRQRGVVLLFCLIILVVLLAGGVALIRSMNTTLFGAGNLAFKRDLLNQGQQAVTKALGLFAEGGALVGTTIDSNPNLNSSAVQLAANAQGIPSALLGNDTAFEPAVGLAANDITGATPDVKIRYVIERLCSATGAASSAICVQSQSAPSGGSAVGSRISPPTATVYRLTARVTGPRETQVFLQTSFSKPD